MQNDEKYTTPLLPGVPTMEEAGLGGFPSFGWWAMVAPKGTPQPIIDKLSAELIRQTKDSKFAIYLERQAVVGRKSPRLLSLRSSAREKARTFLAMANQPLKDYKPAEGK